MSYKTHNRPGCQGTPALAFLDNQALAARCANGEHDFAEAERGYVTYFFQPDAQA